MTVSFLVAIGDSLCFRRATQASDDEVWKINIESKMNVIVVEMGLIIESGRESFTSEQVFFYLTYACGTDAHCAS